MASLERDKGAELYKKFFNSDFLARKSGVRNFVRPSGWPLENRTGAKSPSFLDLHLHCSLRLFSTFG